jgi:hypothetical protein
MESRVRSSLSHLTYTELIEFANRPRSLQDPVNANDEIFYELETRKIKPMTVILF